MIKIYLCVATVFTLVAMTGCGSEPTNAENKLEHQSVKTYNENELQQLIQTGMSLQEITNLFGHPDSEIQISEEESMLLYSLPPQPKSGLQLVGFNVRFVNGKVMKWSPAKQEIEAVVSKKSEYESLGRKHFELFMVGNALMTNVLNQFELDGRANVGQLEVIPECTFEADVYASESRVPSNNEVTVVLKLNESDAAKLENVTSNKRDKRTILACQGEVIAAPLISEPIKTDRLTFSVKDGTLLKTLRER
jgi:hypothetical protein